jgi:hypothetical protein
MCEPSRRTCFRWPCGARAASASAHRRASPARAQDPTCRIEHTRVLQAGTRERQCRIVHMDHSSASTGAAMSHRTHCTSTIQSGRTCDGRACSAARPCLNEPEPRIVCSRAVRVCVRGPSHRCVLDRLGPAVCRRRVPPVGGALDVRVAVCAATERPRDCQRADRELDLAERPVAGIDVSGRARWVDACAQVGWARAARQR